MKKGKKISIGVKGKVAQSVTHSESLQLLKEDFETPFCTLNYTSICRPTYFPGCSIPRYNITASFDLDNKEHATFLKELEELATKHGVENLGKLDDSGRVILTFRGRDIPDVYMLKKGRKRPLKVELEHDLPGGIKSKIKFDLKLYFDRRRTKNGFTFPPKRLTIYLDEQSEVTEI